MSTEEVLREKIRRKPKVAFRISRNSLRTRKDENGFNKDDSFDRENGYKGKFNKNANFRGSKEFSGYERRKFYERGKIDDRENGGYKGKLRNRENFRGMESSEERSGEKFRNRGLLRTRKDDNRFNKDEVFDRENGYKGKLKKNDNFRGMDSGEERSGERFHERGRLRTRKDDSRFKKDGIFDRESGYKGKLKKNVNSRGMESGEERSGERFHERGKLRTFDSFGRKKRMYADPEGMDENGKLWSGVEISKKKPLFKKGEKKVRDETVEEKIVEEKNDYRTIWDLSKLKKVKTKDKLSDQNLKNKKEIDGRKIEVVSPSISDMKKPGLDEDAEKLGDRRWKKKKRVIRIDPYDISNKRLDDAIAVDGIYFTFRFLYILRCCLSILPYLYYAIFFLFETEVYPVIILLYFVVKSF
jgi:hypothetical protein